MSQQPLNDTLKRHYESKRLSGECVDSMRRAADGATNTPSARVSLAWRISPWLSAAAALLLTLTSVFALESQGRSFHEFVRGANKASSVNEVERARGVDQANPVRASSPVADIIVLKFSADWCKPSGTLAPNFQELRREHDAERVLFVDLDLTDEVRSQQAKMLIAALGIEEVWSEHGGTTGEMIYVDPATRRVIRTFDHEDLYDEMHFALNFDVSRNKEEG